MTLSVTGTQYYIDGVSTNGKVYHMGNGVYTIQGTLTGHPSKFITGTNGVGVNEETSVVPSEPRGYQTTPRTLTVTSNFVRMSLDCNYHGSMGGHNIFEYNAACSGEPASAPVAAPVAAPTQGPVSQPTYYG